MGTYEEIAERVLRRAKQPLSVAEILDRARAGPFGDLIRGGTPQKTFHARMSTEIRKNGDRSKFVRVGPGVFGLREFVSEDKILAPDEPAPLLSVLGNPAEFELYDSPPRELQDTNEEVVLIDTQTVDRMGFVGFKRFDDADLELQLASASWTVETRAIAETLTSYRQLIAYTIIRRPDKILAYSRGTPGEKDDLIKGKRAVGVGGHTTSTDISMFSDSKDNSGLIAALRSCAAREILEELDVADKRLSSEAAHAQTTNRLKVVGLINDESSEIGLKRLAVVFEYEVPQTGSWKNVKSSEKGISSVKWIAPYRDGLNLNEFEYWSILYFENRFAEVVRQSQEFRITDLERLRNASSFCVLGGIGSGKSHASRVLAERLNGAIVNSGVVLSEIIGLKPVPQTNRALFQKEAQKFMQTENAAEVFAAAMIKAGEGKNKPIIYDGIRNRSTLLALKRLAPSLGIIFISAPPHIAHQLYNLRGEKNGIHLPAREFMALRRAPTEYEVQFLARYAHAHIYNWIGEEEYTDKMAKLVSVLEGKS